MPLRYIAVVAEALAGPGFYPQPNEWTCGPFALKHALLALGRMVDVGLYVASHRCGGVAADDDDSAGRANGLAAAAAGPSQRLAPAEE